MRLLGLFEQGLPPPLFERHRRRRGSGERWLGAGASGETRPPPAPNSPRLTSRPSARRPCQVGSSPAGTKRGQEQISRDRFTRRETRRAGEQPDRQRVTGIFGVQSPEVHMKQSPMCRSCSVGNQPPASLGEGARSTGSVAAELLQEVSSGACRPRTGSFPAKSSASGRSPTSSATRPTSASYRPGPSGTGGAAQCFPYGPGCRDGSLEPRSQVLPP